ncbi:exocyst complex subunit Sec15-like protein [Saitoella complicata NRRL Y-17804]|nr:exocyst complex subunit Sec15-like protein [Saitoella complicata NRRL Y-17804]ODQ55686.1 exocyst complex subunit Sec15-like protein [Saitoella complicata NRRL Y-17804]
MADVSVDDLVQQVQALYSSDTTDADLQHLAPIIQLACSSSREADLVHELQAFADRKEQEIERLCNMNHADFVASVDQLLEVRQKTVQLREQIMTLNDDVQESGKMLGDKKKALIDTRSVTQNVTDAHTAITAALRPLHTLQSIHALIAEKKHYQALRSLDELQLIHLKDISQYSFAKLLESSMPATQKMIQDAVMGDLRQWLLGVREQSRLVGQLAFDETDRRRRSWHDRIMSDPVLNNAKLNTALELVLNEMNPFSAIDNDRVRIDFTPLHECIHIYSQLGLSEELRTSFEQDRRRQRDLLLPASLTVEGGDVAASLEVLLEDITGFAIIEQETLKQTRGTNLRSSHEINDLFASLTKRVMSLTLSALAKTSNPDTLLRVKNILVLFIQTVEGQGYDTKTLNAFILTLFEKYAGVLKEKFSIDFGQIVAEDDYMPMTINDVEEYEKVCSVSWYKTDTPAEHMRFPCALPFSQIFPLCCVDIRNFVNQYYLFSDEYTHSQNQVDDILKNSLDELLVQHVNKTLLQRLHTNNLGQVVQIIVNLEHFENACSELEQLLAETRSSHRTGAVKLKATNEFGVSRKNAEKRIFELVNSKIDDFLDIAEYDWAPSKPNPQPSSYLLELVRWLRTVMQSTMVNLPQNIRVFIYFDALDHLASELMKMLLSTSTRKYNEHGIANFDKDISYLEEFVEELNDPSISAADTFLELRQSVNLLRAENVEEYLNTTTRMKSYSRLKPQNAITMLEKQLANSSTISLSSLERNKSMSLKRVLENLRASERR